MLIQINYGDVKKTDAIERFSEHKLQTQLERYAEQITRVEVHLHDENGKAKAGGEHMRCLMEARPAGMQPLAVEHSSETMDKAITEASGKLARAVKRVFDKRREI